MELNQEQQQSNSKTLQEFLKKEKTDSIQQEQEIINPEEFEFVPNQKDQFDPWLEQQQLKFQDLAFKHLHKEEVKKTTFMGRILMVVAKKQKYTKHIEQEYEQAKIRMKNMDFRFPGQPIFRKGNLNDYMHNYLRVRKWETVLPNIHNPIGNHSNVHTNTNNPHQQQNNQQPRDQLSKRNSSIFDSRKNGINLDYLQNQMRDQQKFFTHMIKGSCYKTELGKISFCKRYSNKQIESKYRSISTNHTKFRNTPDKITNSFFSTKYQTLLNSKRQSINQSQISQYNKNDLYRLNLYENEHQQGDEDEGEEDEELEETYAGQQKYGVQSARDQPTQTFILTGVEDINYNNKSSGANYGKNINNNNSSLLSTPHQRMSVVPERRESLIKKENFYQHHLQGQFNNNNSIDNKNSFNSNMNSNKTTPNNRYEHKINIPIKNTNNNTNNTYINNMNSNNINNNILIQNKTNQKQIKSSLNGSMCDLLSTIINQCDISMDNQNVNYTKFDQKQPKYPLPEFVLQYQLQMKQQQQLKNKQKNKDGNDGDQNEGDIEREDTLDSLNTNQGYQDGEREEMVKKYKKDFNQQIQKFRRTQNFIDILLSKRKKIKTNPKAKRIKL